MITWWRNFRVDLPRLLKELFFGYMVVNSSTYFVLLKQFKYTNRTNLLSSRNYKNEHKKQQQQPNWRRRQRTQTQQKQHSNNRAIPLRTLKRFDLLVKLHVLVRLWFMFWTTVKHIFVLVLKSPWLSSYHWLDCLALGRFRSIGRINRIGHLMLINFGLILASYRLILYFKQPNLRFSCLEFILYDREQILQEESSHNDQQMTAEMRMFALKRRKLRSESSDVLEFLDENGRLLEPDQLKFNYNQQLKQLQNDRNHERNPVFYLNDTSDQDKPILRPNRTVVTWTKMVKWCQFGLFSCAILLTLWWVTVFYYIGSSIATKFGFELSYPQCVEYIRSLRQQVELQRLCANQTGEALKQHLKWEHTLALLENHVYKPGVRVASDLKAEELPFRISFSSDTVQWSTYHVARIMIDLIENFYWYSDFAAGFSAHQSIIILVCVDLFCSHRSISGRLDQLLAQLRRRADRQCAYEDQAKVALPLESDAEGAGWSIKQDLHSSLIAMHKAQLGRFEQLDTMIAAEQEALDEEIRLTQTLLLDHLLQLRHYHYYVALILTRTIGIYFSYAIIVGSWALTNRSQAVGIELFWALVFFGSLTTFNLFVVAQVRQLNFRLYGRICSCMALHPSSNASRERWARIMKFYKPNSLYCFCLGSSTEVSFLFILKYIFSSVNLLLVMASLFFGHVV